MTSNLEYKMTRLQPEYIKSAKKRWNILARALKSICNYQNFERSLTEGEKISVRRFTSYDLFCPIYLEQEADYSWLLYTALINDRIYEIVVSWINKYFSPRDLIGFNNTGNVCIWPSEECMAYYLLKRPEICKHRRILELGGGMSCLAGVLVAKYCTPNFVMLTDGNPSSVANVMRIVKRNHLTDSMGAVKFSIVQWAEVAKAFRNTNHDNKIVTSTNIHFPGFDEKKSYDVIICADCLFFDEARLDLVELMYGLLADDGIAIVIAPRRGSTFRQFTEVALQRGFKSLETENYDEEIWSRHLTLLAKNLDYCSDLHFPILLQLTKKNKIQS